MEHPKVALADGGESSFYTWLYTIAANKGREWLRAHRTISLDALEGAKPEALTVSDGTLDKVEESESSLRLKEALSQIPERYRRPLVQRFIGGHSIKQIARTERVPLGTVLSGQNHKFCPVFHAATASVFRWLFWANLALSFSTIYVHRTGFG